MYVGRCEPTYEELKLVGSSTAKDIIFCCEPTYEELKPEKARRAKMNPSSCEPTYEELKLFFNAHNDFVPVRLRAYL